MIAGVFYVASTSQLVAIIVAVGAVWLSGVASGLIWRTRTNAKRRAHQERVLDLRDEEIAAHHALERIYQKASH